MLSGVGSLVVIKFLPFDVYLSYVVVNEHYVRI